MKRVFAAILVLFLVLSTLGACTQATAPSTSATTLNTTSNTVATGSEPIEVKVGYAVELMDNNQTNIYNHIVRSFGLMNEKQSKYKFTTFTAFDANRSADKMSADLETAVVNGYDLMIVQPVDPAGVAAAYEYCWDNDLKIVDIRAVSVTDKVAALYAGLNDKLMADAMYAWVKDHIEKTPDTKFFMGLVYPDPGSTGSFIRLDMMKQLASEMPDRLQIIGEGYGYWATEQAQKLTEDWIQGHPEMNIVIAANDESALGCINALESAGIKDKVIVMGVNAARLGTDMVLEGRLDVDIGVKFEAVMDRLAEVCIDLMDGKEIVDPVTRQVDVSNLKMTEYVTAENVKEWDAYIKQFDW